MAIDYESQLRTMAKIGQDDVAAFTDTKSAPSLYWRLEDGRVQLLQGGVNGSDRIYRGGTPLAAYGQVLRATRDMRTDKDEFRPLVERNGQHELGVDQTLGLRWHRRPNRNDTWSHKRIWELIDGEIRRGLSERDALDVVLPQLRGVTIPDDIPCQYCHGRIFTSRDHLAKHESVMHREDVRTRELRDSIADALRTQATGAGADTGAGGLGQLIEVLGDSLARIAAQNAETNEAVAGLLKELAPRRRGRPPKDGGGESEPEMLAD